MSFEDISVGITAKVNTTELQGAIRDFDNTEKAVQRLKLATQSVKNGIEDQAKAIRTLRQAERTRNFETLEGLRLIRSATSLFRDLNQVYQTLILRQINSNQVSFQQSQRYKELSEKTDNLVNALDVLGPSNDQVRDAFNDLISSADDLSSTQLKNLIDKFEELRTTSSGLSEEELTFLNEKIGELNGLLKETSDAEQAKRIEDLFGTFATVGTTAGALGTFGVNLANNRRQLASMASLVVRFKPEIAAILILLFGPEAAKVLGFEIGHAGGPTIKDGKLVDRDLINDPPKGSTGVEANIQSRFAQVPGLRNRIEGMGNNIHIDFRGSTINRDVDVDAMIKKLDEEYRRFMGENLK